MIDRTAESKSAALSSGSWSPPGSPITIDYPLELLDEIRLAVSSSFHANIRGGVEVGGVFFGTRMGKAVRITAWRLIFRANLGHVLESATTDPSLKGLEPVGWFVPHARGSIELSESDLRVFDQFFPREWQFTLVLQPELVGPTKAAFFVRDADGTLRDHKSDHEFMAEPLRAARVHGRRNPPPPETDRVPQPRASLVRASPATSLSERTEPAPLLPDPKPASHPKKKWLGWLLVIPVAGVLIYAALFVRQRSFVVEPRPSTLSLKLEDWPGVQLNVSWERDAQPIHLARRGELVFEDAGNTRTVELDAPHLRLGSFAYARRSGNVKVKLSVYGENSAAPAVRELSEFSGPPPGDAVPAPAPSGDRLVWQKQKTDLDAEIKHLRGQLATETAKRQELQNLVRVLENRLNLTTGK